MGESGIGAPNKALERLSGFACDATRPSKPRHRSAPLRWHERISMGKHASNSEEQQKAESIMLNILAEKLDLNFDERSKLPNTVTAQPDAIDLNKKTIIEAYAHIGSLKGAQTHKVKGDILKLILVEKQLGGNWKKILCFADDDTAKYVRGGSWVAEVVRTFDIEVQVVNLPQEQKEIICAAQKRQRMVNPEK